jgi:hypothetical protein
MRRGDARLCECVLQRLHSVARQRGERGVQQCDVLALQQTDTTELVREGDGGIGHLLPNDLAGALFHAGIERRKD